MKTEALITGSFTFVKRNSLPKLLKKVLVILSGVTIKKFTVEQDDLK